jgi:hypothetical protein
MAALPVYAGGSAIGLSVADKSHDPGGDGLSVRLNR